jgi:predicted MFS family arabinose efflux permease
MLATIPLAWLLNYLDWRVAVFGMGALAAVLAVAFFTVVPEKPETDPPRPSLATQIRELAEIYHSPVFWWITPLAMISTAGFAAYLSLWIGLWARDVAGADRAGQALHLFVALAGMLVGNVLFGVFSQVETRWQVTPVRLAVAGIVLFIGVQVLMALEVTAFSLPLMAAFGVFSSGAIMLYTVQSLAFPPELAGRAVTAMNVLIFATNFAFQWGVGVIIHRFPVAPDGRYDAAGHQLALAMIIGLEIAAVAWFLWRPGVVPLAPACRTKLRRKCGHVRRAQGSGPEPLPRKLRPLFRGFRGRARL